MKSSSYEVQASWKSNIPLLLASISKVYTATKQTEMQGMWLPAFTIMYNADAHV